MYQRLESNKLLCVIRQDYHNAFCSQSLETAQNKLHMLNNIHELGGEFLGMMEPLPILGLCLFIVELGERLNILITFSVI